MNELSFKLIKINTEQFAVIDDNHNSNHEGFNLNLNAKLGVDADNRYVKISLKFLLQQDKLPFIIIEVSCEFEVSKNDWELMVKGTNLILPKEKMIKLTEFIINTTRGILHTKTENTPFNKYIIPNIQITDLVSEDAVISLL